MGHEEFGKNRRRSSKPFSSIGNDHGDPSCFNPQAHVNRLFAASTVGMKNGIIDRFNQGQTYRPECRTGKIFGANDLGRCRHPLTKEEEIPRLAADRQLCSKLKHLFQIAGMPSRRQEKPQRGDEGV